MKKFIIHINASLNNTIYTITDLKGNTLFWITSGNKLINRPTELTAMEVGKKLLTTSRVIGIHIILKGIGPGRISSIKGLKKSGIKILTLRDMTPIPHNGCRPSKQRRL